MSSSVIARWLPPAFSKGLDPDSTEGAIDLVFGLPNNNIARQQQSDIRIGPQCLVCDPRIADAENPITAFVNGQLLFEYCLQVDIADDSKSLFLQLPREHVHSTIEIRPELN
jgi:hypothetical protein